MTIATIAKTGKNRLGPFGGGVCMRRNPFQIKASFQSYESDVFFASGVLRLRHFPKVAEWNGAPRDGGKGFATRRGGAGGEPRRATIASYRNG